MARNRTFSLNIGWRTLLKDVGLTPPDILRKAQLPDDTFSRLKMASMQKNTFACGMQSKQE